MYFLKVLIKFLSLSSGDIHAICLIGGTTLYCLYAFYLSSSSLLQVALVDPVIRIRCVAPVNPVVGASSPEITTIGIRAYRLFTNNWYQSKVNVKMSAIKFDIQKFDGVINFSGWHIRMNAILTQSGLKKTLLRREKKPQDMKEETW